MSLSFAKEAVGGVTATPSLLSSTLLASSSAAVAAGGARMHTAHGFGFAHASAVGSSDSARSDDALSARRSRGSSGGRRQPMFTVAQVIAGLVNAMSNAEDGGEGTVVGLRGFPRDASRYDLRIAEDDGGIDADYPPVDFGVAITAVGTDKFVLVETASESAVLRVCIPPHAVQYRPCEGGDAPLELPLTCYLPVGSRGDSRVPSSSPDASPTAVEGSTPGSVRREPSSGSVLGATSPFVITLTGMPAAAGFVGSGGATVTTGAFPR